MANQSYEQWADPSIGEGLQKLFEEWKDTKQCADWVRRYRVTVDLVDKARSSNQPLDDEFLSRIWEENDNGIARAGQGCLQENDFEKNIDFLRDVTNQIISSPNLDTYQIVVEQFENQSAIGAFNRVPRLLIRRAFAAASPQELFPIVYDKEFNELGLVLSGCFGLVFEPKDSWFDQCVKLHTFLSHHEIPYDDEATLNTFPWYLLEKLGEGLPEKIPSNEMPRNIILYGPPGTGKTYELRNKYFQRYESQASTLSSEEWIKQVVSDKNWREVIAATLVSLDLDSAKVNTIINHEFMRAKANVQGTENIRSQAWGCLQNYTSLECENVQQVRRLEPGWFWKNEDSSWGFAPEWEETGGTVHELVTKLKNQPHDKEQLQKRYEFVTFHQSYSYEEFVEGIRPTLGNGDELSGDISYELNDGVFKRMCNRARGDKENRYAIFIDEINRGNISKILGELITLIEPDKREGEINELSVKLPYSSEEFSVPNNLDIYGTMNTADRSLAYVDVALRRRFTFIELTPDLRPLRNVTMDGEEIDLKRLLETMNNRIEALLDRDHMIGHAYFIGDNEETLSSEELSKRFQYKIIPLLTEYFFDDWSKVRAVLADDQDEVAPEHQFIHATSVDSKLVPKVSSGYEFVYRINKGALNLPEAYTKIYSPYDGLRD